MHGLELYGAQAAPELLGPAFEWSACGFAATRLELDHSTEYGVI